MELIGYSERYGDGWKRPLTRWTKDKLIAYLKQVCEERDQYREQLQEPGPNLIYDVPDVLQLKRE